MVGSDSGDGIFGQRTEDEVPQGRGVESGGAVSGAAEYLKKLAAANPSAYEAPVTEAAAWLGHVATSVGWVGNTKDNLKLALCYHLIVHGSSPDVALETPLAVPGTGGGHKHGVLVKNLGVYTLRQMAATILVDKVDDCLKDDNVKNALRPRAARAGLDGQHMRLAVDFLPPSRMTPSEMHIREAGRQQLISRRNRSKRSDLHGVGERSEQIVPDAAVGPVGDVSWS